MLQIVFHHLIIIERREHKEAKERTLPVTTIKDIQITELNHHLSNLNSTSTFASNPAPARTITVKIIGNAFLRRQVRNIVACLVDVGCGKIIPLNMFKVYY